MDTEDSIVIWQPVLLLINNRITCKCGAKAVIITGRHDSNSEWNQLTDVDCWCQDCYIKAQTEE